MQAREKAEGPELGARAARGSGKCKGKESKELRINRTSQVTSSHRGAGRAGANQRNLPHLLG